MKTILLVCIVALLSVGVSAQGTIPDIKIRTLDGVMISSVNIFTPDQPYVIIFWQSNNTKCSENLENMQSAWQSQLKNKGVKLVAISIDCIGTSNHIKPFVYGKAWEFDVFIDVNGDFKRAMGVTDVPFTLLFDKNRREICRHAGYCAGNEDMVCQKILNCLQETENKLNLRTIAVE